MDEREIRERIHAGREFIRTWERPGDEEYQSDQDKRLPQPPLAKAAMTDHALELPKNFEQLELKKDVVELFYSRNAGGWSVPLPADDASDRAVAHKS